MLNLRSLGELHAPLNMTIDTFWSEESKEYRDMLDQLMSKADVVRVTLKNGNTHFMAEANKLCGVCDDCTEFHKSDVIKYEFFKV